jgi:hypothetical protein
VIASIEIAQLTGIDHAAASPMTTACAHSPIEVGDSSVMYGTIPPSICGTNRTASATAAMPADERITAPSPMVSARKNAGTARKRTPKTATVGRSGTAPYATLATTTETAIGSATAARLKTIIDATNLAARMLVGETGLVRLHASVPRSRSTEMMVMVAMIATRPTIWPLQPRRALTVGSVDRPRISPGSAVASSMRDSMVVKMAVAIDRPATTSTLGLRTHSVSSLPNAVRKPRNISPRDSLTVGASMVTGRAVMPLPPSGR